MKRAITFLILILTSLTISASEKIGTSWLAFNGGAMSEHWFFSGSEKKYSNIIGTLRLGIMPHNNRVQFYIYNTNSSNCTNKDPENRVDLNDNVMYFESQAIKYSASCQGGDEMIFPKTNIGNDFIINKFISLNYVQFGSIKWNAKGFTNQHNRIKRELKAL